ncbi:MAG TPA: hypothetical protein P5255_05680 [Phycisphaerae bacterium]|jgi:hypothetical protein|nr:hypothetical protein [Phycisphaerae bacterium]
MKRAVLDRPLSPFERRLAVCMTVALWAVNVLLLLNMFAGARD